MLEELVELASLIKKQAEESILFKRKFPVVASILIENISKLSEIEQPNKIDQDIILQIKDNMTNISAKFNEISNKNKLWAYIPQEKTIQQIINDINNFMRNIYSILSNLGIKNLSKLPSDKLYDDYTEIDEYLDQFIVLLQARRKEINEYLKQNHENYQESDNKSLAEINKLELSRYQKYKLDKESYVKDGKCDYFNDSFDYYYGHQISTNREVTILELKKKEQFVRLLSVLTKIDHPNVESFIGAYIENSDVTLVTNRSGISLEQYILAHKEEDEQSLRPGDRTILAFKIAQAMSYLHSRSIIHRNLVTSNIFIPKLTSKTAEIEPIVVGFKNSRLLPSNPTMGLSTANITNVLENLATTFYAPEYGDGHTYDEKVDVFSFSGILFELLTGHKPFRKFDKTLINQKLVDNDRPQLPEDLSPKLSDLITKCWQQEPKDRYTFDEIIEVMSEQGIIFPQDESNKEIVNDFYSRNKIKSSLSNNCAKKIETIKRDIGEAFQYKFELLHARSILHTYQNLLRQSEFSFKEKLDENEQANLKKLLGYLDQLKNVVSNLSFEQFDENAKNIITTDITQNITDLMTKIYNSMIDVGFEDLSQYKELDNNLVFDYRELRNYFNEKTGRIKYNKIREIDDFCRKRNLNGDIPKRALKERIKDLFSPFQHYQIDRNDFEKDPTFRPKISNVSTVYKGRNKLTKQIVAIKVISERYLEKGESNLILLRKEIGYLARLKHKYIADFIGFGLSEKVNENDVWLVSEFVPDGTLFDRLRVCGEGELKGEEKTIIAFKIAELMNYFHSKRVLHLDIKSTNILLKGITPKIIDFGFACPDNDVQKIKNENIGTANYRAPEIFRGELYDYKADVFSYSMLLWELVNDTYPYSLQYDSESEVHLIKEEIINGVNLDFREGTDSSLIKLIKSGYDSNPMKRPTFEAIINTMVNEKIMYPGSNRQKVLNFYKKREKRRIQERTQSAPAFIFDLFGIK